MTTKSPTELQVEIIHWLTSLPSEKIGEVYSLLSPLLNAYSAEDEAVWDVVVETIYSGRAASKASIQQKFDSLAWDDE